MKTVVVVHTGPATVQPLKQQFQALLPDVRVINIMDDSLLNDVMSAGHLTQDVTGRIFSYMQIGQQMGADVLLNACSSVREAASVAEAALSIPLIRIDDAMAEKAISLGKRIGVVATVRTTLEPTVRLIRNKAASANQPIEIEEALAEGAFQALLDGKTEEHDRIVTEKIQSLAGKVDAIVLAQASMARLVPSLTGMAIPVLSSPQSGVESVREALSRIG